MKKIVTRMLCLVLLAVLTLTLVSCSTYGSILDEFEAEGYTEVSTDEDATAKTLVAETQKGNLNCTVHVLKAPVEEGNGLLGGIAGAIESLLKTVVVLEFESDDDLTKAIAEDGSETLKGLLKDVQKSEYVNGNCLLVTIDPTAKEIFSRA
jgi:hypothetical protein